MVSDSPSNRHSFTDRSYRLNVAADRLDPESVAMQYDHVTVTAVPLRGVVALCDLDDLDPDSDYGKYLLVHGIDDEAIQLLCRSVLTLPDLLSGSRSDAEFLTWLQSYIPEVEDEIAAAWGSPVAGVVEAKRADPDFFARVRDGCKDEPLWDDASV